MKILMIAENDPAGTAILFCRAVNSLTPHSCRLVTAQTRYNHAFEHDLHLPLLDLDGWAELEQLLLQSDVFHFHMTADEDYALGPFLPRDYMRGKLVLHHHHGHPDFRGNPEKYRRKYRERGRRNLLVSTPDLLKLLPEARWQPNLVPVEQELYRPARVPAKGAFRLGHSPTRKDLKNTAELRNVVENLKSRGKKIDLELIDDAPHKECLRRKQACHAVFDHMQGYYGVSSLEALSQGKPTIAGLDAWNAACIKERFGCTSLPWVLARDEDELAKSILDLAGDEDYRRAKGMESRAFMEEVWNTGAVAGMLAAAYEQALPDRVNAGRTLAAPAALRPECGRIPGTAHLPVAALS